MMVVMLLLLMSSCKKDKGEIVDVAFDPDNTYTMRTTDISSLISDSGITRYRLVSPELLIFDKAAEPYWYFPHGLYVEQFDTLFNTQASFKADTAYNWTNKKLWKAIGNVEVENLQGERFETDLLYWDQEKKLIYSDAYMRIEQEGSVITGIGFESNENMSEYRIYNPQGSVPVNEEKQDSTRQNRDTTSFVAPPARPALPPRSMRPTTTPETADEVEETEIEETEIEE